MRSSRGGRVVVLGDLDAQVALGVGARGAGDAAADALEGDGAGAAGDPAALGDAGDRADAGVVLLVAGDHEHPLLVADLDREGRRHAGEEDGVVEGDEKKFCHAGLRASRGQTPIEWIDNYW